MFTSVQIANYIRSVAFERGVWLNKTQLQKLLFIAYGVYYALYHLELFTDDTPKAWPFGPVFPIVNKRIDIDAIPSKFEYFSSLEGDSNIKEIVDTVVAKFSGYSAKVLSDWSHEENGPWYKTVYGGGPENVRWNKEIDIDLIDTYFKENFLSKK